jgi:hypothetical protein
MWYLIMSCSPSLSTNEPVSIINLFCSGTVLSTAERLSNPPSCPPEQPQGFNAPSSSPVKKTVSASFIERSFSYSGVFFEVLNTQEVPTVKIQMQVINRVIYQPSFILHIKVLRSFRWPGFSFQYGRTNTELAHQDLIALVGLFKCAFLCFSFGLSFYIVAVTAN